LIEVFRGVSDRIQSGRVGELILDITGTAHLFQGEEGLLQTISVRADGLGQHSRSAIADDPLVASVWARCGAGGVVPVGQGAKVLAPLPFLSLGPSEALYQSIRALDIDTIGEWAALDPASVAGRYGQEGVTLHRVARGQVVLKNRDFLGPPTDLSERVELTEPARRWPPIEWALRAALQRLVKPLALRERRATQLRIHLLCDLGEPTRVQVRLGRPSRDVETLLRICRHRMERVQLSAPVTVCWVEVEQTAPESADQHDLLDRRQVGTALPEVVARLSDGLGERAVFQAVMHDSWRPERAWQPLLFGEAPPQTVRLKKPDPVAIQQGPKTLPPLPRPTLLLPTPCRVQMREVDGHPSQLKWEGQWWAVVHCRGPERLCTEWWREDGGIQRNYWTLQFANRTGWVFQDEHARWALHGWFG
jgi:protein ImuB